MSYVFLLLAENFFKNAPLFSVNCVCMQAKQQTTDWLNWLCLTADYCRYDSKMHQTTTDELQWLDRTRPPTTPKHTLSVRMMYMYACIHCI